MALTGSQKAYVQARSAIARSGASRSNYVFPLFGFVIAGGYDLTKSIRYGTLRVNQQINDEPDTASFEILMTSWQAQTYTEVGQDVVVSLGGPTSNVLFGGRVLTTQTTWMPGRTPSVRAVMCADYLQVLDSEFLITYGWPAQSATATILDLFTRFAGKDSSAVVISMAGVATNLPSHAAFVVVNEKFSTVLRRLVTMFSSGGGFYIDPLKVLHVWQGASEPNLVNPQPLTIDLPTLKGFAETVDGSQVRDVVIVEGARTSAPAGMPAGTGSPSSVQSIPVGDASIGLPEPPTEQTALRIGSQRVWMANFIGPWLAPAGTPTATDVTADVPYDPGNASPYVIIPVVSTQLLDGRANGAAWIKIDNQYLRVDDRPTSTTIYVPRTGFGSPTGPIKAGAACSTVDSIYNILRTPYYGTGPLGGAVDETIRAQPIDADVVLTIRSPNTTGIHEHLVQDGRYTRQGATNRATQELADFSANLTSIDFETEDLNAKPGRLIAYSFDPSHPFLAETSGQFMIVTTEITWPVWGQPPRMRCHAAAVSPADITDVWLTDPR